MNIKNYTSEVTVARSMAHIHEKLVEIGATSINYKVVDKITIGIIFLFDDARAGRTLAFQLKAQVYEAYSILIAEYKRPSKETPQKVKEQAARTAWKILSDWIDIQCSMILLGQAEPLQMFLPYMYDPATDKTFYEKIQSGEMKKLLA